MARKLDDFLLPGFLGGYDIEKLSEVPPKEFREMYIDRMKEYPLITSGGKLRKCEECSSTVDSANELVRYFGLNIHTSCFEQFYSREREDLCEQDKLYFDLVLKSINAE